MSLTICNGYSSPIHVAIAFRNDGCGTPPFETRGWWNIDPGACARVWAPGSLKDVNQYWYYYAEADDGVWWGDDRFVRSRPFKAFSWCWNTGTTSPNRKRIRFKRYDIGPGARGYDDVTIKLKGPLPWRRR